MQRAKYGAAAWAVSALAWSFGHAAVAQTSAPQTAAPKPAQTLPGGQTGAPGQPQTFRWTEDWSKAPADNAPLLDKMHHIALSDDGSTYLSLGGEERLYLTNWDHSTLGLNAHDANRPIQNRFRLNADLHIGSNVRAYLEVGDNREWNETTATKPNQDAWDLYQGFIDLTVPLGDAGRVTLRPGRFEMPLGNGKLMGVREGLNMRFTYQGVRATYILPGKVSIDLFSVRPVNIKTGRFDDGPNPAQKYQGAYVGLPEAAWGLKSDIYWYRVERQTATLREGVGRDKRNNLGVRVFRTAAPLDLDIEANRQTGQFAGKSIDAWAVMAEGGYTRQDLRWKPRLGLRFNIFSGDDNLSDGKAKTFAAASPRLPLITEGGFFNLSNLVDFYPSITLNPTKALSIMVGPDLLWRQSKADGVYIGSSGRSFAPYAGGDRIGTDYNLEVGYKFDKRLSFRVFETYFRPSDGFKVAGGKSGNYFGALTNYRF